MSKLKHGRNGTGEDGPCEPDCEKCVVEARIKGLEAAIKRGTARGDELVRSSLLTARRMHDEALDDLMRETFEWYVPPEK